MGLTADPIAERHQELDKKGSGIGLRAWFYRPDDRTRDAVESCIA
jgi:hypothetical protein